VKERSEGRNRRKEGRKEVKEGSEGRKWRKEGRK
jgi:hypothetical protein